MKAGAFTPATRWLRGGLVAVLLRSMKAGAFTPATLAMGCTAERLVNAQ